MKYLFAFIFIIFGLTSFSLTSFAADDVWEDITPPGASGAIFNSVVSIQDYTYVATDNGVFLSDDHGETWTQINTGLGNLNVRSVAIGWVYDFAAQGGLGGYVFDSTTPILAATANGIYSSQIGSTTWTASMSGLTNTDVFDIEFDTYETSDGTLTTNTVYAATPSGVFRSDDNGVSWSLQNTGMGAESVRKIATDWSNGTIFAVTASDKVYTSALYSFSGYTTAESWALNFSSVGTTTEDVNLLDPNGGYVWLASDKGIFKSDSFGSNWETVNEGLGTSTVNTVSSDHNDPNLAYAALSQHGVYRTTNEALGTPQWLPINTGLTDLSIKDVQTNAGVYYYVFAVSDSKLFRLHVSQNAPYPDMTPPDAITDLVATASTTSEIVLTWTATGDDLSYGTATSYDVRYSESVINNSNWVSATIASGTSSPQIVGTSESMSVTGLDSGTTYYFGIKAIDNWDNVSSLSNVVATDTVVYIDTTDPSTPSDLTGTSTVGSQVDLTWTASTDNVGVAGYKIFRGLGSASPVEIATSSSVTYSDTGLTPLTEYTYSLIAYDASNNLSATSATTSVFTIPTAPENFSATSISTSQINLSWDSTAENIDGYNLYRNGTLLTTLASSTTSYSNTGLSANTAYSYSLRAYDSRNFLSPASTDSATTQAVVSSSSSGGGGGSRKTTTEETEVVTGVDQVIVSTITPHTFSVNLSFGDNNSEVRELQIALNALGYTISTSGAGSPGNESTYFGEKTVKALQAFQRDHKIVASGSPETTGYGNFGLATREELNVAYKKITGGGSAVVSGDREALLAKIAELKKLIEILTRQLNAKLGKTNVSSTGVQFQRMLVLGETSEDVRNLQKKLNAIGITVAQSGVGSLGYESTYFGTLTVDAIKRFQCKYSIVCSGSPETTGYGNFGLKTRLMLNSL